MLIPTTILGSGGGSFDPDEHMPWMIEWFGHDPYGKNYAAKTGWDTVHQNSDSNVHLGVVSGAGGGRQYGANALNDSVEWDIPMAAGTWDFQICVTKYIDSAIVTLSIDGVSVGTFDCYAAGAVYSVLLGVNGIAVATTGKKRIKLQAASKNASSSGYLVRVNTAVPLRLLRTA